LQLEDSWVTRFEFRTNGSELENDSEVNPRVSWEIRKSSDDGAYLIDMRISCSHSAFRLLLDVSATLSFPDHMDVDAKNRMVNLNGPAILYGVARGIVGSVTGLAPTRRIILPSVNIISIAEQQEKRKAKRTSSPDA
jgi:hypothetical protein